MIKTFASYILRAAEIREQSWNGRAYTKTIHQAVDQITPQEWRDPVYLLLQCAWNDALDWAKNVMQNT